MVSVIIPTFNREKTIIKSVQSVLDQTYSDLEVIIVDDGSVDNTRLVVESLNDARVVYVHQDNLGACAARNHGIDMAHGDYIAFQDSDDTWMRDKIEKQMSILQRRQDVDIVCCKMLLTRPDGTVKRPMKKCSEGIVESGINPIGFSTQTFLMRKRVTDKIRFDVNVTRYQDVDFILNAIHNGGFVLYCVDECLVNKIYTYGSISTRPERLYDMSFYFEKKYPKLISEKGSRLAQGFASGLLEAGYMLKRNGEEYEKYLIRAMELSPSIKMHLKKTAISMGVFELYRKLRY